MKLEAIIILTNQCNLNCAHCVYACDLSPKPYFITLEEIHNTLILMKEKLPSLNRIMLSGGDAFMHPLILQICNEIRKIFPNIELCAYTNGLLLHKISNSDILKLTKDFRLNIVSSMYPNENNLKEYKKQDQRFKNLGIELYYQFSHFYFSKQNYRYHGLNLPKEVIDNHFQTNCRTLTKYNNLITIYKNKILTCCGEVGFFNLGKADISDLLDLNTLQSEQEILDFCEHPHNICKDCVANSFKSDCNILWTKKNNITQKHQQNSLQSIFVQNYSDYKKLFLDNDQQFKCYQDKFFSDKFGDEELEYLNIKYKTGLGDIFIPYDNSFDSEKRYELYNKLLTMPNIEKYNLYFIGIKTSNKINNSMFKQFYHAPFNSKIKATFLLSNTLISAYEEFLQYSYLKNKILLDVEEFLQSFKGEYFK